MLRRTAFVLALAACGDERAMPPACDVDACAADGKLCDGDACVDPWQYGSPVWSRCPDAPRATPESLAAKAAAYDTRARDLHVHPQMPWILDVALAPGTDPETATWHDVAAWRSGENDGLWSALVLAAEAYRFAATHDPDARTQLATLLAGERLRTDITGVPGLFTRQLIPPGVPGIACPTDPAAYLPSPDKRGNKWVRIDAGGCAEVSDPSGAFHATTHCGLARFASWCFLDNISQDEYAGHVFALGAVARLVDDANLRGQAVAMLHDVGVHLAGNGMQFVDWDGRPTQWGKVFPGAPGDTAGYLAVLGLGFAATAARGTDDPGLATAYAGLAWDGYLNQIDQWLGDDGCGANWNNLSMLAASFYLLIWNERDPARRRSFQDAFDRELARPAGTTRGKLAEHDAWFDMMWATQKPLGPNTDGPAYAAVEDAVCQLREFPRSNHVAARDTTTLAPGVCTGRQGESLSAVAFGAAERCAATYLWWGNPYLRDTCTDQPTLVQQPAGFLLPYWMGRYFGFIPADL